MSELIRADSALTIPSGMRSEASRVKRRLLRTKTTCTALSLRSEWCKQLRLNAKSRNAVSIREIASGPNFILLASLSLFGTALCWIIGDMMHWILGILFAIAGLGLSFFVALRVTFNATLFTDTQLEKIQSASMGRLSLLNLDVEKLESELRRLQPLVEAEILYEREMTRIQAEKQGESKLLYKRETEQTQARTAAEAKHRLQSQQVEQQMWSQLRRSGSAPTEKQLRFSAHLKMRLTGSESKEELSLLIDRVLEKQTPEQEDESKRRWMQQEHRLIRSELEKATLQAIEDAIQINREMGEAYVTGFVVIRGDDCGTKYHGKFVKINHARNELHAMPPFEDCNFYKCQCEAIEVVKGETAREVFRQNSG